MLNDSSLTQDEAEEFAAELITEGNEHLVEGESLDLIKVEKV